MRRQYLIGHFALTLSAWLWLAPVWAANSATAAYEQTTARIITGFEQGTAAPFNAALDAAGIVDQATHPVVTDSGWMSQFRTGLIAGINPGAGERLLGKMAPGSYIKLLKLTTRGKEGRALLRFDFGDQGNGYLELIMNTAPDGEVRIVDWYDYAMGQRYTTSLQQITGILAPSPTFLGKLYDVASERKEVSDALKVIFAHYKRQEHVALAQQFLTFDESIRSSRVLNLIAIQSANASGDEALYHKLLANLERYHGDDEKLFFILLDYYFLEQEFDRVLTALDRLVALFGQQDAALEVIRSNTLYSRGDFRDALSAADRAIALEPEYEWGHLSQFTAELALQDYAGCVKTAAILQDRFGYDMSPESLGAEKEFVDLLRSEPYRRWRSSRLSP